MFPELNIIFIYNFSVIKPLIISQRIKRQVLLSFSVFSFQFSHFIISTTVLTLLASNNSKHNCCSLTFYTSHLSML